MKNSKKLIATLALFGLVFTSGATTSVSAAGRLISRESAKNAALTAAGVSLNQATAIEIEYDADDDDFGQVYEVEFKANGYKYSYDIDANNGSVLKSKRKLLKIKKPVKNYAQYITAQSAKQIALNHAGLNADRVTFTKAKLTTEDGIRVYEVEFIADDYEYEYEIDAKTGRIIEFSVDSLYDYDDDDFDFGFDWD